jgi:16S rRNA (uracil1498-N3)-methyltransferase
MNVFVCSEINAGQAKLMPEEAFHCFKVLRKKEGDEIILIDGTGNFYRSVIRSISKNKCESEIIEQWKEVEKGYYLHVLMAPTKNISRFEWFIEKSIEIGIDEITPVLCKHSERKNIKLERLQKIALGAVKQSLAASIPRINPMTPFDEVMKQELQGYKICAHLSQEKKHLKHLIPARSHYHVLIGPEGDFSENELRLLNNNDWQMAVLGNKRLRTETAGLVATQIINGIHF